MTDTIAPSQREEIVRNTPCPHCHKRFDASVDMQQPPRLQGAKCPHCRLFVPARVVLEAVDEH